MNSIPPGDRGPPRSIADPLKEHEVVELKREEIINRKILDLHKRTMEAIIENQDPKTRKPLDEQRFRIVVPGDIPEDMDIPNLNMLQAIVSRIIK